MAGDQVQRLRGNYDREMETDIPMSAWLQQVLRQQDHIELALGTAQGDTMTNISDHKFRCDPPCKDCVRNAKRHDRIRPMGGQRRTSICNYHLGDAKVKQRMEGDFSAWVFVSDIQNLWKRGMVPSTRNNYKGGDFIDLIRRDRDD